MSTDLTVPAQPGAVSLIQQTAHELTAAHQIASAIASTSFVPVHFRGKPDECAVAILYGATVGFDPMTAVQQLYVIGGKPALYARAMVAIVLSKGHSLWVEEEEPGRVTVAGQRKGTEQVQRITWTTDDARRAGYTSNKKYETDPRAMLYARASGDIARRIAPDALMGMAYTVEELELGEVPATPAGPSPRSGVSRLRAAVPPAERAEQPAPSAEPAPVEDVHDAEVVADEPQADGITPQQLRKMTPLMREAGLTERAEALEFVIGVIGRDVTSRNDLTKAEAGKVIDALEATAKTPAGPASEPVHDETADAGWPPVRQPGGAS